MLMLHEQVKELKKNQETVNKNVQSRKAGGTKGVYTCLTENHISDGGISKQTKS
jgi:hypothetical protein